MDAHTNINLYGGYGNGNGNGKQDTTGNIIFIANNSKLTANDDINLYGGFVESGRANVDTHSTFTNQPEINTNGNSEYSGGGIFARLDYNSKVYSEVSLRLGSVETTQSSAGYQGFVGQNLSYDASSTYYGAHLGIGRIWELNNNDTLDIYGKYLFTHQDGDSAIIAGDSFRFDDIDSQRIRIGVRYSHDVAKDMESYIVIAWDHEFGGDANYSVQNTTAVTPTIEGDTGIIEVGFHQKLSTGIITSVSKSIQESAKDSKVKSKWQSTGKVA